MAETSGETCERDDRQRLRAEAKSLFAVAHLTIHLDSIERAIRLQREFSDVALAVMEAVPFSTDASPVLKLLQDAFEIAVRGCGGGRDTGLPKPDSR